MPWHSQRFLHRGKRTCYAGMQYYWKQPSEIKDWPPFSGFPKFTMIGLLQYTISHTSNYFSFFFHFNNFLSHFQKLFVAYDFMQSCYLQPVSHSLCEKSTKMTKYSYKPYFIKIQMEFMGLFLELSWSISSFGSCKQPLVWILLRVDSISLLIVNFNLSSCIVHFFQSVAEDRLPMISLIKP